MALAQAGLDAGQYRLAPLLRRVPACLRALKVRHLGDAAEILAAEPSRWSVVLDALLIGVTGFFRDATVFEELRRRTLPALVKQCPGGVHVWSVACSDGAELYSVALLLMQLEAGHNCRLIGSDCRPGAIERARAGQYSREMVSTVPPGLRRAWFQAHGESMLISEEIRKLARWYVTDAMTCPEAGMWDLILCRNLTIYLDPGAVSLLWQALNQALRPGGVLVTGKAERPAGGLRRLAHCIYLKETEKKQC